MSADAIPPPLRAERLDALRGLAMLWMAVFHFCFDLNHFRLLEPVQRFTSDPFWTLQRTCIVTLFVFCAGASQSLAAATGQSPARFWQRWMQVLGCALLVTAGSWWMFPRSFIFFGVLHGMATMLLLSRPLRRFGVGLWVPGLVAIVLPLGLHHPVFDSPGLVWLGLAARRPITEDFVPLLPWIGVFWWGMAAAAAMRPARRALLGESLPRALRPLALLGRWPLSFYMLHQPVLIGALMLALGRAAP